ncbi:MAG: TM2 domain-containing protein [Clostridia bacterium]
MTENELFSQVKEFMPSDKLIEVKNKIKAMTPEQREYASCAKYNNPITILLLSIFLGFFGVDRFAIGDLGVGVAKLLLGWLTMGIWPLVDIFFCYKKAKIKNFNTLIS